MRKHVFPILLMAAVSFTACNSNKESNNQKTDKEMTNKEKAVAVLKSIETGDTNAIAFINAENYTQHNLTVEDGLDGFGKALAALSSYPEKARVNTVRAFEDGDYVFMQTDYNFFGNKIGFDVFRFEDGKIVEHWDNLMETPSTPNPSNRTCIDGTTDIKDLDKTEANKELVKSFVNEVLMNKAPEKTPTYFNGDAYIQHNSAIADGLSGLGKALEEMAKNNIAMIYDTLHIVLGEGNFVLAISEGTFAGKPTSYYDLFRVEDGKIAEHWDVMETIADKSEWKHNNGKYSFKK